MTAWQRGGPCCKVSRPDGRTSSSAQSGGSSRCSFSSPTIAKLLSGQIDEAQDFFSWYQETYPNDLEDPGFQFGWALSLADRDEEKAAVGKYRRGMIQNLYLAPLLLDVPEPAPDIWQHNDRGDIQYAVDFLNSFGAIWDPRRCGCPVPPGRCTQKRPPFLDQLIVLRRKMAEFQDHRYEPKNIERTGNSSLSKSKRW